MKTIQSIATLVAALFLISSCQIDNPLVPPTSVEPILLDDRYDSDITLSDHNEEGVDYIAESIVNIFGGRMTIEPGVTIEFEEGAGFNVGIDGRLNAEGTSSQPIRMIAEENEPSWVGIYFNTEKANSLEHVIIEHAGVGKNFGVFNDFAAAITIDGTVSIENTTISESGDVGVIINDANDSEISAFSGNTIKNCANYAVLTNINYLHDLDLPSNTFTANGRNMIAVTDRYSGRLSNETELFALDIPYFLTGDFEIYANLTINKGVEIVMDQNSLISHDAGDNFLLEIKGTEAEHVVIRGDESENGFWQGIYMTSQNSSNQFEFLDISDGGGAELTFRDGMANIALEFGAKLSLISCTSARSGSCEVVLSTFGDLPDLQNESPAITNICEQ